jgi:hypothetical protein
MPIIKQLAPVVKQYLPQQAQDVMSAVGYGKHKGLSKRLM